MSARQWVAYAGLDPKPFESGGTAKPRRLSKQGNRYLRDGMYMPALVAICYDPHVKAYYQHLIEQGKKPKQAIAAVMRKLLVAIWAMFHDDQEWQPEKFYKMTRWGLFFKRASNTMLRGPMARVNFVRVLA